MDNINILQNYKNKYDYTKSSEIIILYKKIINEYLLCCLENLLIQDYNYYLFVVKRGINTIKHCFKILLMYSKNINIVAQSCKKVICYYVEFIGQIGEDSNSYLQLNSKDATLFVYKKILFDIDSEHCKQFELTEKDTKFLNLISVNIDIYNNFIVNSMFIEDMTNKKESIKNIITKADTLLTKIYKGGFAIKELEIILYLISSLYYIANNREFYIETCMIFSKKFLKLKIDSDKISEKLYRYNSEKLLNTCTPLKFVNWLFS